MIVIEAQPKAEVQIPHVHHVLRVCCLLATARVPATAVGRRQIRIEHRNCIYVVGNDVVAELLAYGSVASMRSCFPLMPTRMARQTGVPVSFAILAILRGSNRRR